jgi:hypothetical protein
MADISAIIGPGSGAAVQFALRGMFDLGSSISGSSSMSGSIDGISPASASIYCIPGSSMNISGTAAISANLSGSCSVSPGLQGKYNIEASIAGTSSTDFRAALGGSHILSGSSSVVGTGKRVMDSETYSVIDFILNDVLVEPNLSIMQALRLMVAAMAGKTIVTESTAGTGTVVIRDLADTKNRIVSALTNYSRTSMTYDKE